MSDHVISLPRQLGLRVRETRTGQGLSRARLALEAGVSERLLASLELGDAPGIRLDKLMCVLDALGMELIVRDAPGATPHASTNKGRTDDADLSGARAKERGSILNVGPSTRMNSATHSDSVAYADAWQGFLRDQGIDVPAKASPSPWDGGE